MAAAHHTPPTVLVVDDEPLVTILVSDVLAEAGYRVVCAPDGRTASPDHEAWTFPDVAVVNLRLARGLDGRDVIRSLRRQRPNLPVVVITGFDALAPEANLRGLGGPTVRLGKPIDCDALLEHVARLLTRPPAPAAPARRYSDLAA